MDIENREDLVSYLRKTGLIASRDKPEIFVLTGGVSNRTVLVRSAPGHEFVVKQALQKLRVKVDWYSDPDRIQREARGLIVLHELCPPGSIPRLLFEDAEQHLIIMEAVPEPAQNWKAALLSGQVNPSHFEQFARLLGTIHRESFFRAGSLASVFSDRSYFETLRLEPYYQYSANQVRETAEFFSELIQQTMKTRVALVHGDYSPKNILIHRDELVLLDHEVIHFGDPAFDVGFSLAHILSKAHHVIDKRGLLIDMAKQYANTYLDCVSELEWSVAAESRAVRHAIGCLLARVIGRSPLEYLTSEQQFIQKRTAIELTMDPPQHLAELVEAFGARIACA